VQPRSVGHHRVDERRTHVDPPSGRAEHPLDKVGELPVPEDRRRQLAAAPPGDEHPARLVDPDLLDLRVVEVALQRTEAGHPVQHVTDDGLRVGDRRQRRVDRPLGVVGDHVANQHPDGARIGERVEPATPDELADLAVHDVESGRRGKPDRPRRGQPST
jgi:hypothetical protein